MMLKDNSKNIFRGRIRGIGLIELCVFIVATGLIVMAGAPLFNVYETHKHMDVTNASVAQTQVALDAYYQKNGTFPSPAQFVKVDGPGFGMADPATCTGVICNGAVPTRTLGLPDSAGIDGWNHLLTYAITQIYTGAGQTNMMHGGIYVTDSKGNPATASLGNAVYVVVPANPDGAGAHGLNGFVQSPCSAATGLAAKICNADGKAAASAFISTTLQGNPNSRFVTNAIAMRADTCATGNPTAGNCGNNTSNPLLYTAYLSGTLTSSNPALCQNPPGTSSFFTLPTPPIVGNRWNWICNGSCQASNANCWANVCQPVNASCGTATGLPSPTKPVGLPPNLCGINSGTYGNNTPVKPTGSSANPATWQWQWTCKGNCLTAGPPPLGNTVAQPVNAQGVPLPPTACTTNPACIGATSQCSTYICQPVNGACGSANGGSFTKPPSGNNLCSSGAASNVTGTNKFKWTCDPPSPPCLGTNCKSNPACLGIFTSSCSAKCVSDGSCTITGCDSSGNGTGGKDNCGQPCSKSCTKVSVWVNLGGNGNGQDNVYQGYVQDHYQGLANDNTWSSALTCVNGSTYVPGSGTMDGNSSTDLGWVIPSSTNFPGTAIANGFSCSYSISSPSAACPGGTYGLNGHLRNTGCCTTGDQNYGCGCSATDINHGPFGTIATCTNQGAGGGCGISCWTPQ